MVATIITSLFAADVQAVKELASVTASIQRLNLRNLMSLLYQKSKDVIFQMLFCS